ncbi:MAG: META domain-containing protein [Treponema sp.]|nr:META domain-containing protein [Treponema sp.]
MKKNRIVFKILILGAGLFASCASKPNVGDGQTAKSESKAIVNPADFSEVLEKTWELIEVKSNSGVVIIERQDMQDMYTVRFAEGRLSGRAAPNLYNGPYTQGNSHDISFGPIASTKMVMFQEPESLKEHEYFSYLAKTIRWMVSSGQLMLFAPSESGDVVLAFNEVENVD